MFPFLVFNLNFFSIGCAVNHHRQLFKCKGIAAVEDTFKRAFNEWKGNYKYLTELVMVLNHKIAQWYERNMPLAKLYNDAWNIADNYAVNHLQGDELNYFYNVTD